MYFNKFLSLLLFLILFTTLSYSLPRYAMRLGDKCIDCHVNPTGGIIRNENGWHFGKNLIGMISPRDKDIKLSPKLTNNISLGFDYRIQYLYSEEKSRSDFQDMTGSIYANVKISKKIDVVARYDFVNFIWEAYAVARLFPNNSYIKAGTFQPYFGIRLDDHTAYTRGGDFALLRSGGTQGLIYGPLYLETGIELGAYITDLILFTTSVGKGRFNQILSKDPTFTARLQVTPSAGMVNFLIGGSYATAQLQNKTQFYGGFLGVGYDAIAFVAEYDLAEDYENEGVKSSALMAEIDYLIIGGLEATVRFDLYDPNINVDDDELAHIILGFEFFPYSFVEIRPQYRFHLETPGKANNAVVVQLHLWY